MTPVCAYRVTLKFTFGGRVWKDQLTKAILRAVRSKAFRLVGSCTVLEVEEVPIPVSYPT